MARWFPQFREAIRLRKTGEHGVVLHIEQHGDGPAYLTLAVCDDARVWSVRDAMVEDIEHDTTEDA